MMSLFLYGKERADCQGRDPSDGPEGRRKREYCIQQGTDIAKPSRRNKTGIKIAAGCMPSGSRYFSGESLKIAGMNFQTLSCASDGAHFIYALQASAQAPYFSGLAPAFS